MSIYSQSPHSEYFFEFGDPAGEAHFILWHHLRHHTYDLLSSKAGSTLPPLDLKGDVTHDWLKRHADRHTTLRKIAGGAGNSLVGMIDVDWEDPQQQADWLRIHALDHSKLDAFFRLP